MKATLSAHNPASQLLHRCTTPLTHQALAALAPRFPSFSSPFAPPHQPTILHPHTLPVRPRVRARLFTTTRPSHKKRKPASNNDSSTPETSDKSAPADPNDFITLQDAIETIHTRLKADLSKLKTGRRENPESVENLRVPLGSDGKTERLGDLGQVVVRGRRMSVVFGDQSHAKPISAAIQRSNMNLTPQADASSPLQLNINLPPVTTESRMKSVREATQLGQKAATAVQTARATQHKVQQSMKRDKSIAGEELKKAVERLDKVVEKGNAGVKRIVDGAKKMLESG